MTVSHSKIGRPQGGCSRIGWCVNVSRWQPSISRVYSRLMAWSYWEVHKFSEQNPALQPRLHRTTPVSSPFLCTLLFYYIFIIAESTVFCLLRVLLSIRRNSSISDSPWWYEGHDEFGAASMPSPHLVSQWPRLPDWRLVITRAPSPCQQPSLTATVRFLTIRWWQWDSNTGAR